jgi:four helix bundle protein
VKAEPERAHLADRKKRQASNAKLQTPNATGAARVYDLEGRLLSYAAWVIRLVDSLHATKSATHVGGQLLRSGTAPLSSHGEAQAAESIDDFIHKLKIAHKELQESWRWLRLIRIVPLVAKPALVEPLIQETEELVRIFAKSLQTAEARRDSRLEESPGNAESEAETPAPLAFEVWSLKFGVPLPARLPGSAPVRYPKPQKPRRAK